jgi:hypothetical protein
VDSNSRLEFLAIPMTIIGIGIIALLVWAGNYGAGAWIALGIVGLIALIGVTWYVVGRPHRPPAPSPGQRPQGAPAPPDDGVRRVLVIAGQATTSDELRAALSPSAAGSTRAFVVAPVLGSRTSTFAGDEHDYQAASANLEATLTALKELSVPADGHVGSHDPIQAVDDGLREFPAGEILFVVRESSETSWLEHGVVDEARTRYPIPVKGLDPPAPHNLSS